MKILQGVAQAIADDRYYQPRETSWAELCERLARECAKNEQDSVRWEKEFLDMLGDQLFIPAGRILRNLGNIKPSTSNCNLLPIGDSIEEIGDAIRDYIVISSYGGGTGINFSPLRPKGAPLKTKKGFSSGMVSFIELFNHAGWRIKTGGDRRAAGIALCHVSHPEIFDFINAKTKEDKLNQFNISVVITKEFLMAVEAGTTWDLKFAGKIYDTVKARKIWDTILENMLEYAEPGLINWDNLIKNNSYYFSPITGVNPCGELPLEAYGVCLSKDTKLFTKDGVRTIQDFSYNTSNEIIYSSNLNFEKFSRILNKKYNGKKTIYSFTLDGGRQIRATANHKIYSTSGWKKMEDIMIGDQIKIQEELPMKPLELFNTDYELFGWIHGDGWFTGNSIGISFSANDGDFYLKDKYLNIFHNYFGKRKPGKDDKISYQEQTDSKQAFKVISKLKFNLARAENRTIPSNFYNWTLQQQLSFVRGLFSADGGVLGKSNKQIGLWSRSLKLIKQIQEFLSVFGIHSKWYTTKHKDRKNQYKLLITKESAFKFMKLIGFSHKLKQEKFNWSPNNSYKDHKYIKVIETNYIGKDDVYDIEVPETRCFFANGILVHNCNLGSLPIANYIVNKNTNLQKFAKNIHTAVRFLDNIIDLAYYPISQQEPVVKAARRIGLGTMGVADYLFAKQLRYGSEEALSEVERVYKFLRDEAYGASIELAKEKGAFPAYNKLDYTSASFIRKLPAKIRMEIKEHSIRNATLLAAAPTGTTSLLAGMNGGIEPLPYKGYWRTDGLGKTAYINPHCEENYDAPWFVDAYDLKPEDHLETQFAIQKYIDGGVSKTIILPNKTNANKLSKLLLEYIYDLKGVTVYRDGSREIEVYTRMNRKEVFDNLDKEHTTEADEGTVECATGACDI